eukprot:9587328-Alexandrium_andersonii.AAC.1
MQQVVESARSSTPEPGAWSPGEVEQAYRAPWAGGSVGGHFCSRLPPAALGGPAPEPVGPV